MKNSVKIIAKTFKRYRLHVAILTVFGILSSLLEGIGINAVVPLLSFFMGGGGQATDFINQIVQSIFAFFGIPFIFRYLLAFILLLFITRAVTIVAFGYVRGWINADFLAKESEDVMRRTLLSSWAFSLKQKIGTIHNTLVRDVQQTGSLLGALVQSIQSVTGFMMYLLVAINISPTMTMYAVGGGAVLLILLRPLLKRTRNLGTQTAGVEKRFAQFLSEHIIGMKSIKAAGAERPAIASGNSHIWLMRHLSIRQSLVSTIGTSMFQPSALVLVVVLFLLTYNTPEFNIISFAASLYLLQKIFAYLESGQNSLQSLSALVPYAENLSEFKRNLDLHREHFDGAKKFFFERKISFDRVSFSYDENAPVLNSISFELRSGETVGLIGPSGAGKTTVADLLLRLFKPTGGTVSVDGIPVEEIALDDWRKNIGHVSQDIFLMNDTIEQNIRFYDKSLSSEDIMEAAKQANIYEHIMSLPEGFQTVTGDRGLKLSGGQRQRIALARALARRPSILILDEATSALDVESEQRIQQSIRDLKGKMTILVIAHRLSTIAQSDRLIVLEQGKITDQGSPAELLKDRGTYYSRMYNIRE